MSDTFLNHRSSVVNTISCHVNSRDCMWREMCLLGHIFWKRRSKAGKRGDIADLGICFSFGTSALNDRSAILQLLRIGCAKTASSCVKYAGPQNKIIDLFAWLSLSVLKVPKLHCSNVQCFSPPSTRVCPQVQLLHFAGYSLISAVAAAKIANQFCQLLQRASPPEVYSFFVSCQEGATLLLERMSQKRLQTLGHIEERKTRQI